MEFVGYLALIGIGIILSLMGGGGSLLSMPVLVYLFSLDVVTASSYSLFIVGTTSFLGVWLKQKEHRIDMRSGMLFSGGSVIAIFATRKWILPWIPEMIFCHPFIITKDALILVFFASLAIVASSLILLKHTWTFSDRSKQRLTFLLPISVVTGIVVGLVGVGGGFLILPSLIIFARLPFKTAVGTTLLVISLNSLLGFLGDVVNSPINWFFLLIITALATLGMWLGNLYDKKISTHHLRLTFGWILLVTAAGIIVKELLF